MPFPKPPFIKFLDITMTYFPFLSNEDNQSTYFIQIMRIKSNNIRKCI